MLLAIAWLGLWPGAVTGLAMLAVLGLAVTGSAIRVRRA
jgi:hypothetical protein